MTNLIERLAKQIKLIGRVIVSSKRVAQGITNERTESIDGIRYIVCSDLVLVKGAVVAFAAKNLLNQNIIVVDDYFVNADDDIKRCILHHELGHIINGDVEWATNNSKEAKKEMKRRNKKNYLSERELKADENAYNNCGYENMMKMFDFLEEIFNEIGMKPTEIIKRRNSIIALNNK